MPNSKSMILWCLGGPAELELVRESGRTAWPLRLPDQPIFYQVLNEDYAMKIARHWNAPREGVGYVTRFEVDCALAGLPSPSVGSRAILERWVLAEDLEEFNRYMVDHIEATAEFQTRRFAQLARQTRICNDDIELLSPLPAEVAKIASLVAASSWGNTSRRYGGSPATLLAEPGRG
nr:hypothetical protein [Glycomyces artemisiae]